MLVLWRFFDRRLRFLDRHQFHLKDQHGVCRNWNFEKLVGRHLAIAKTEVRSDSNRTLSTAINSFTDEDEVTATVL